MKVIYYYSYLFYKNILKDDTPHVTTIWVIGFGGGFFISVLFNLLCIHFFCFSIGKWAMIGIGCLWLIANYFYFSKSNKSKEIMKNQPLIFASKMASKALTLFFFLITISSLFWGPMYAKYLLTLCGK